jgi:hypothetical protein
MNNEINFDAPTHSLLLKQGVGGEEREVHENKAANCQSLDLTPSSLKEAFHVTKFGAFLNSQCGYT